MLLKDDATQRNDWRLRRVVSVKIGEDQNVWSVVVQTSTHRSYERPISKIVLLVEAEVGRIPDKEPTISEWTVSHSIVIRQAFNFIAFGIASEYNTVLTNAWLCDCGYVINSRK